MLPGPPASLGGHNGLAGKGPSPHRVQPAIYPLSQTLVAHSFFPLKRRGELSCGLREIIGDSVVIQKGNRRATDSER